MSNVATEQLVVELDPVKKELRQTLQQLQAAEQTRQVRDTIATLERALFELKDKCGLSMVIPITAR